MPTKPTQLTVVSQHHANAKHNPDAQDFHPDLQAAFVHLVAYLTRGTNTESELANYADTAVRAAKAFADITASREEIAAELREILKTAFPREALQDDPRGAHQRKAGLITQGPIQVHSMCPHHLLSVEYEVYVSYIPDPSSGVLGLSKLARIASVVGKRPVLQEQLASDIADVLHHHPGEAASGGLRFPSMASLGSAVLLTGKHSCMTCRGIRSSALTSVTELRGSFWDEGMEQKFHQSVAAINSSVLRRS